LRRRWVVWNAWRSHAHEPQPQVVDPALDSGSDYSLLGLSDDSSDLVGTTTGDDDDELLLGDVDLFLLPSDGLDLDALPSPPAEYAPPAEQSDGLVDEPATVAPLSLLLVPPPDSNSHSEPDAAAPAVPPVARPPMRRTASLPNVGLGGYAADEDRRAQAGPRIGTWEVARGAAVVACEG